MNYLVFLSIITVGWCAIPAPKKFEADGGFMPSSLRYFNPHKNRTESETAASSRVESKSDKDEDRLQRFGISSYGNTGISGYPHTGTGVAGYTPLKIDLGGVVLGALIGLGVILVIPKIAHVFSGGYRRSVDSELESMADLMSRFDKILQQHEIDSGACMQRIVCSYVKDSQKNIILGKANTVDELIATVSNNSLLSLVMDGTGVQRAVQAAAKPDPDSCDPFRDQCPLARDNIMQLLSSLLPA